LKEIYIKGPKPIQHDLRLSNALSQTGGWNILAPSKKDNRVANFRCQNCGTLQGIGTRDMQSEFEHKCPVCGLCMVFNRQPRRLDGRQQAANKRMMLGNDDPRPNPLKDLEKIVEQMTQIDNARRSSVERQHAEAKIEAAKRLVKVSRI